MLLQGKCLFHLIKFGLILWCQSDILKHEIFSLPHKTHSKPHAPPYQAQIKPPAPLHQNQSKSHAPLHLVTHSTAGSGCQWSYFMGMGSGYSTNRNYNPVIAMSSWTSFQSWQLIWHLIESIQQGTRLWHATITMIPSLSLFTIKLHIVFLFHTIISCLAAYICTAAVIGTDFNENVFTLVFYSDHLTFRYYDKNLLLLNNVYNNNLLLLY